MLIKLKVSLVLYIDIDSMFNSNNNKNTLFYRFGLIRFDSDRFRFGWFGLKNLKLNYLMIDFGLVWISFASVGSV